MQKFGLIFVLFLCLFAGGAAEARKPEPVDIFERVPELLNESRKIAGFYDYETEMFSDNITSYSFILASGNKYAAYSLVNPAMNNVKSKCRALN